MSMLKIRNVLVSGLFMVLGASAARGEVQVTDWHLVTRARDATSTFVSVVDDTVSLPYSDVHTAADGPTWAQSTYDFTVGAHTASFDLLFDYNRSGTYWARAETIGWIDFTLTEPLDYSVAGGFTLSGTKRILAIVDLIDVSDYGPEWVYGEAHESNATPDESFTLGVPGGDVTSWQFGGLTGTLVPGALYRLQYNYLIENCPSGGTDPATAEGALTFTLTPEPSSLALLGVGALVLVRRKR